MAEALAALGRPAEAAPIWSEIVREDPINVRGWIGLAQAQRGLGQIDSAVNALETAASLLDRRSPERELLVRESLAILPHRPTRFTRLIDLARQSIHGRLDLR